jgi:predicted metal-dependent hydrolase
LFLGKNYKIIVKRGLINKVFLEKDYIVISMIFLNEKKSRKMLSEWFLKESKIILTKSFEKMSHEVKKIDIKFKGSLNFRKMKSRWGSCSSSGNIILNYELAKTPQQCIDYVILHELCHLKEFNHSKKFYNLVARIMPEWKQNKTILGNYLTKTC